MLPRFHCTKISFKVWARVFTICNGEDFDLWTLALAVRIGKLKANDSTSPNFYDFFLSIPNGDPVWILSCISFSLNLYVFLPARPGIMGLLPSTCLGAYKSIQIKAPKSARKTTFFQTGSPWSSRRERFIKSPLVMMSGQYWGETKNYCYHIPVNLALPQNFYNKIFWER